MVTGATDGIGKEFVRQLHQRGVNVLLVGRSEEKLAAVIDEVRASGKVKLEAFVCDLNGIEAESEQKRIRERLAKLPAVTMLVNCAGLSLDHPKYLAEESAEHLNAVVRVNCMAATLFTQAVLPSMIAARFGVVWNVGSMAAELRSPLLAVYAGSKAYLRVFSEALQGELSGTGVRVELLNTYFVVLLQSNDHQPLYS